jgi:hypothetical protein
MNPTELGNEFFNVAHKEVQIIIGIILRIISAVNQLSFRYSQWIFPHSRGVVPNEETAQCPKIKHNSRCFCPPFTNC